MKDKPTLNTELTFFYAHLRKEDGEDMCSASVINIRYSLARYIKSTLTCDIIKDTSFTRANEVFVGKLAKLKRNGKGATKHYDVIVDDDLNNVAALSTNSPVTLQMKVWFTFQFHFAQRGKENIHGMKKSDLLFHTNDRGKTEIHLRDFMTKNHRASDSSKSTEAFIAEVGGEDCPVTMIKRYLSLLNDANPFLWQKPNPNFAENGARWYQNSKVGENTISKMMHQIVTECKLSRDYTNHCVRSTAITLLGRSYQHWL